MGTNLQSKKEDRNKVKRKMYLRSHTLLIKVRVGLKVVRKLIEARGVQIMIQIMILVQKDQMREEMLIDVTQMLNQTRKMKLSNLTEVLEKSYPQWLNGKRSRVRNKDVHQERLTNIPR